MTAKNPTIKIWTISEKRTFALTADGWSDLLDWADENFMKADMDSGCVIYGRDEMIGWNRHLSEDDEVASILPAIARAIHILLRRISSPRCPADVFNRIPETLERIADSEQTAKSFAELVWAAEGDIAEQG